MPGPDAGRQPWVVCRPRVCWQHSPRVSWPPSAQTVPFPGLAAASRPLSTSGPSSPGSGVGAIDQAVRLGDTEGAEQALAELGSHDRDHGETHIATATLRLAQDNPHAAVTALAPVLDRAPCVLPWIGLARAFLLEAIARDALGEPVAAGQALERALDLAEPDRALSLFLLHPAQSLLERHARHGTAHTALISQILDLLSGTTRSAPAARQPTGDGPAAAAWMNRSPTARPASCATSRPTSPDTEIAKELFLSVNTVSTHMRHLYAKLGVHNRHGAVDRARALGLLAPPARRV